MFGRRNGSESSAPTGKLAPLSPGIRDRIMNAVGYKAIPPLPDSVQRAFELTVNPTADARDFITVIESDESLAARILKMANSVYFDRGSRCTTIDDAVGVIGLSELRNLLCSSSTTDIFPTKNPLRVTFWEHNLSVAIASRVLAKEFAPALSSSAFFAGLMHDIGKLILIQRAESGYREVVSHMRDGSTTLAEAELLVYPFDHTEVGQIIGESWSFPPEVILAIRHHHRPLQERSHIGGTPTLCDLVMLANTLVHAHETSSHPDFRAIHTHAQGLLPSMWNLFNILPSQQPLLANSVKQTIEQERDLYTPPPNR